jgi:hypothetical protein
VFAILGAGVVGLLMFNTHMQQASFYATRLQARADDLTAREQKLDMELERLRAPQRLAAAGKALGMVAPGVPAFVKLSDGSVVGRPTPASPQDAVRINPLPPEVPAALRRKPIVIRVPAPADTSPAVTPDPAAAAPVPPTPQATGPKAHHKPRRGAGR